MSAHLEALEGHLDVILDPSLEPNTQSMDGDLMLFQLLMVLERIVELTELLRLCSRTMMEFTVALQRKLASIAESKDTAHKRLISNAMVAALSIGVAIYSRPTRLAARAAHFAAVMGSCSLAYYFYTLEQELGALKAEQEKAIEFSSNMTTILREHIQTYTTGAVNPLCSTETEMLASLSRLHFVLLKDDLKEIRTKLDELAPPKTTSTAARFISWW